MSDERPFTINGETVPPVEDGETPTLAQSVAEMFSQWGVESIVFEDPPESGHERPRDMSIQRWRDNGSHIVPYECGEYVTYADHVARVGQAVNDVRYAMQKDHFAEVRSLRRKIAEKNEIIGDHNYNYRQAVEAERERIVEAVKAIEWVNRFALGRRFVYEVLAAIKGENNE